MADYTNYPEMTDELLQKFIGHALQQATKEDTRSPLSSGLLTAGLAMMANSRGRNFGEALGQGGLLGLQAYGAQKELAKKDPTQMISLLTAVEGLKEKQQGAQWLKNFSGATAAPAQYAMGSDFAPGEASGPVTPPMQPQMVAPPMVRTAQGMQMGPQNLLGGIGLPGRAGKLSELLYKQAMEAPVKAGPGDTIFDRNIYTGKLTQGPTMANLDKNLEQTPEGVRPYTGVTKSLADIEAAKTAATEAAKAGQDVIQVTEGGRTRNVTRAQWIAEQQQKPQGVPADIQTLYADYLKGGGAERGEPFKLTYMPKPQPTINPTKAEEAVALQQATMPGEMNKTMAEGLGKYSVENFAAGHKAAEDAAYTQLPAIQEVRKRIGAGAFTGGGAETKTEALNFLNGWLGTSIASPQIAQSQALKSALGYQVLANAKKLGANPTEADAKRIDDIVGKQGLSQEALLTIAEVQEKLANQIISRHNKRLDSMESVYKERGIPTDTITGLRVQPPEIKVEAAKPPQGATSSQLKAIEDEILRRRGIR